MNSFGIELIEDTSQCIFLPSGYLNVQCIVVNLQSQVGSRSHQWLLGMMGMCWLGETCSR